MKKQTSQQVKDQGKPMSIHQLIFITAIVGALFFGGIHSSLVYFHFSEVNLMQLMDLFHLGKSSSYWVNFGATIFLMCFVSYIICYLYYFLFRRVNHFLFFMMYGFILYAIFFGILQPYTPGLPNVEDLSRLTNITNICLFVLYGTFVAYTISFETEQSKIQKTLPQKKMNEKQKENL